MVFVDAISHVKNWGVIERLSEEWEGVGEEVGEERGWVVGPMTTPEAGSRKVLAAEVARDKILYRISRALIQHPRQAIRA